MLNDLPKHHSLAGSQIGEMAFGFDINSRDDPFLKVAEDAMACARELMSAGSFLVDSFPLRKSLSVLGTLRELYLEFISETPPNVVSGRRVQA